MVWTGLNPRVGDVLWTFNDKYEVKEFPIKSLVWTYPRRGLYANKEKAAFAAANVAEKNIRLYEERIIFLKSRLHSLTKGEENV